MISQVNSSVIRNAYASNNGESKEATATANVNVNKQGDMSKIEKIKESIESGTYKVDLQALSEKIAEELL
jgi:anti-sigma28 factor (negative regulator of flagellin synthesis)